MRPSSGIRRCERSAGRRPSRSTPRKSCCGRARRAQVASSRCPRSTSVATRPIVLICREGVRDRREGRASRGQGRQTARARTSSNCLSTIAASLRSASMGCIAQIGEVSRRGRCRASILQDEAEPPASMTACCTPCRCRRRADRISPSLAGHWRLAARRLTSSSSTPTRARCCGRCASQSC